MKARIINSHTSVFVCSPGGKARWVPDVELTIYSKGDISQVTCDLTGDVVLSAALLNLDSGWSIEVLYIHCGPPDYYDPTAIVLRIDQITGEIEKSITDLVARHIDEVAVPSCHVTLSGMMEILWPDIMVELDSRYIYRKAD